jgi:hypothetical protein
MKKLITTLSIIGGILVANQAFALTMIPYWSNSTLSFSSITSNTAQVQLSLGNNDEYRNAVSNRQTIKIQYRPWMCGDDPETAPYTACPMIYIQPNVTSFAYDNYGNILPAILSNLQPNTKYRVWLGYDNGIRCIQAPCPSDTWQNQLYSFTTSSNSYPYPNPLVQVLTQKLYFGTRGTQVNILENFLQSQGYMNSYIDTYFGTVTHAAVTRFQSDRGLTPDGIVGPATRYVINQLLGTVSNYSVMTQY